MSLDRPQEPPARGTESGRGPLLGEFLQEVHKGTTALLGSAPMQTVARAPEPTVERNAAGAATALVFNTDSIYQKNAKQADKRFEALVPA